ncbi:CD177 antigen [Cricetulus griseus]|uniref:CD177 antigen n=1 Tax=Cricetulus griseus TaxID=10029 RepID=A0A061IGW2_CRIGR|nr:CD177 antigen [Cricetulus griseus]
MLVASYSLFCSSNLCNEASNSSVLLSHPPHLTVPPPGDLQCPVCVEFFGSCFGSTNFVTCPQGTCHWYKKDIVLQGDKAGTEKSVRSPGPDGCRLTLPVTSALKDHRGT